MSVLDDILEEIDLQDYLDEQGVDYKKGSSGQLVLRECPFCGDNRSRVYFSITKKRGLCFHADCRQKFNLFSFARKHLDTDTRGTIRHFEEYASRYGHRRSYCPGLS